MNATVPATPLLRIVTDTSDAPRTEAFVNSAIRTMTALKSASDNLMRASSAIATVGSRGMSRGRFLLASEWEVFDASSVMAGSPSGLSRTA